MFIFVRVALRYCLSTVRVALLKENKKTPEIKKHIIKGHKNKISFIKEILGFFQHNKWVNFTAVASATADHYNHSAQ